MCVVVVVVSWVACAGLHAAVYLPTPQFYFNHISSHTCEPYHTLNAKVIMVACTVYFPTTMVSCKLVLLWLLLLLLLLFGLVWIYRENIKRTDFNALSH